MTPRDLKARQTKARLSEAAIQLFHCLGVEKVTVDDICTQCGVTKGAFYHHFPSKDHIVTYAVNYQLDRYVEEHFRMEDWPTPQEQLLELHRTSFRFFRELGKNMTRTSYEGQIRSMIVLRQTGRAYVDALSDIVGRCVAEGLFRGGLALDDQYMAVIITYTGFLLKWSSTPEEGPAYRWEDILEVLIRGLFHEGGDR